MRLFLYIVVRGALVFFSFSIFALFGAICAFAWLALSWESPADDEKIDADSSLADFLMQSDGESKKFSYAQLRGGAFWILLNGGKKDARAVVMPAAPIFKPNGENLEMSIDVKTSFYSHELNTRARFIFSPEASLRAFYIGSAIVPAFCEDIFIGEIQRYYKPYSKYLDAAARIKFIDVSPNFVALSK